GGHRPQEERVRRREVLAIARPERHGRDRVGVSDAQRARARRRPRERAGAALGAERAARARVEEEREEALDADRRGAEVPEAELDPERILARREVEGDGEVERAPFESPSAPLESRRDRAPRARQVRARADAAEEEACG